MAKQEAVVVREEGPVRFSVDWMIDTFAAWESEHLAKLPGKTQQIEFGQVKEALRTVGLRIDKKVQAEFANKCGECHKPLGDRGAVDTIPMAYPENPTKPWVNQYACSTTCADKLKAKARERELFLSTH